MAINNGDTATGGHAAGFIERNRGDEFAPFGRNVAPQTMFSGRSCLLFPRTGL